MHNLRAFALQKSPANAVLQYNKIAYVVIFGRCTLLAFARQPDKNKGTDMKLRSDSFPDHGVIPSEFAFAQIDDKTRVRLSNNQNPHLAWAEVPDGTQSFVMLAVDESVPSEPTDVNQIDREVPAELPRVDFTHWVLINIPAEVHELCAGQFSNNVTPRGKSGPLLAGKEFKDSPMRHGINDYTHWFENDHDMAGDYYGYDGPCPPWNDSIVHRYTFTVYALDAAELPLPQDSKLTRAAVLRQMEGHVLAQASWVGQYTLTPRLAAALSVPTPPIPLAGEAS